MADRLHLSLPKPSFALEQGEFADKQISSLYFKKLYIYVYTNIHKLYMYIHTCMHLHLCVCVCVCFVLNYTLETAQWRPLSRGLEGRMNFVPFCSI